MAPRYPNQQLRSVSLETFFSGRFAAPLAWPVVQEMVAAQMPRLFVPGDIPHQAPALRPYQLRSEDNTRSLALAINQVTYIAFEYPGFEEFEAEAVPLVQRVHELIGVTTCTRVAFRYENAIGVGRSEFGTLGLGEVLALDFPEWLGRDEFRELTLEWRRGWEHGEIYAKVFQEAEGGRDVLRLSIAADVRDTAELAKATKLAHVQAHDVFDKMITAKFRSFLEWKPGEAT